MLRGLGILDTPPEERFDRLTRLAATVFDVPIALVSLVDANRQWFKSCIGIDDSETDRSISFCAHALERDDALVVEDALADPRFATNPFVVDEPHVRFYAGQPLRISEGSALGTLCIIDRRPRPFSDRDRTILAELATLVEAELKGMHLARVTIQLAASEAHLSSILSSIGEGVATFTADGTVLDMNEAGLAMFRREMSEIVGHPITDLLVDEDVAIVLELLAERATKDVGEEVHVELCGRRGDGTTFDMEVSVNEILGAEEQMFIAVARDITGRREIDRMKDEFVSVVSHELRTPLTSIQGSLGLLAGGALGELPPDAQEMVEIASANSKRLTRLVNDILDLERLTSGGAMQLELAPTDTAAIVADATRTVTGLTDAELRPITADVPAIALVADHDRLVQAVTNLLGNAVKFSSPGTPIEVRAHEDGAGVAISVTDHGRGVPPDLLGSIFGRFQQVDAGDRREKGGSGLGLAITQRIARLHGGDVAVTSRLGEGSTFTITVPRLRDAGS